VPGVACTDGLSEMELITVALEDMLNNYDKRIRPGYGGTMYLPVADPGFDLEGRGLCQQGGGGRTSLNVLKVEVKFILACHNSA